MTKDIGFFHGDPHPGNLLKITEGQGWGPRGKRFFCCFYLVVFFFFLFHFFRLAVGGGLVAACLAVEMS